MIWKEQTDRYTPYPLIVSGYNIVETMKSAICVSDTPNVRGVIRRLSSSVLTFQRSQNLFEYARKCVQPGIEYFHKQLATNLKSSIAALKVARLFSPQILHIIKPEAEVVNTLNCFPFLDSSRILDGLKNELPLYLAKVTDVSEDISCLEWWKLNEQG